MSYRNDVEALQLRLTQLEDQLTGIRDERARLSAGVRNEQQIVTELDRLRREIHARAPRRLPMLDDVRVASPCHQSWDAMSGDDQSRFCGSCKKNVYNLSMMTREEAESLIRAKEGELCVRFYRRTDGTVLTADCSVGVRRKRVQLVAAAGAVTALAAGAVAAAFAHMGAPLRQGGVSVVNQVEPVVTAPPTVSAPPAPFMGEAIQGGISAPPVLGQMPTTHTHMGRRVMRTR